MDTAAPVVVIRRWRERKNSKRAELRLNLKCRCVNRRVDPWLEEDILHAKQKLYNIMTEGHVKVGAAVHAEPRFEAREIERRPVSKWFIWLIN